MSEGGGYVDPISSEPERDCVHRALQDREKGWRKLYSLCSRARNRELEVCDVTAQRGSRDIGGGVGRASELLSVEVAGNLPLSY